MRLRIRYLPHGTLLAICLAIQLSFDACVVQASDFSNVPGTVIHHSPASSGLYVGSPSIAQLPSGTLVASHDEFGPKSNEHVSATTRVYASSDDGAHWRPIATIEGQFWSTLFVHDGALYLIGTNRHHGNMIIRRSEDGGQTWTEPNDANTGLLAEGEYHCAPQPVIVHDGRIWRAFEDAGGGKKWGERYRPLVISAPVDGDLLDRDSWTFSNHVTLDKSLLGGKLRGWLEGNAVVDPKGHVKNILRVEAGDLMGKAAMMQVSVDGKEISFEPNDGFIDLPGGAKKFTIRRAAKTGRYWTLVNWVMPEYADGRRASQIRNTLALASSTNLRDWQVHRLVIHSENLDDGFQYADWLFDGNDIIAVVRTATDDGVGGPHNYHDANFLTFHRIEDYAAAADARLEVQQEQSPPAALFFNAIGDQCVDAGGWSRVFGLGDLFGLIATERRSQQQHCQTDACHLHIEGLLLSVQSKTRVKAGKGPPCDHP